MILGVTGHRKIGGWKIPNPVYNAIWEKSIEIIESLNPDKIITGMALGFDQLIASICIEKHISFIAAIPCDNQEKMWPPENQRKYRDMLNHANEKVIVSPGAYAAWKMQTRNEWICDNSDKILACWNRSSGGTSNCVQYAKSINKEIIIINPNDIL